MLVRFLLQFLLYHGLLGFGVNEGLFEASVCFFRGLQQAFGVSERLGEALICFRSGLQRAFDICNGSYYIIVVATLLGKLCFQILFELHHIVVHLPPVPCFALRHLPRLRAPLPEPNDKIVCY